MKSIPALLSQIRTAVTGSANRSDLALFEQYSTAVNKARETGKPAYAAAARKLGAQLAERFPAPVVGSTTAIDSALTAEA